MAAPSAVCVAGLVAWSMSINGEYIQTSDIQDGCPVYQKTDGSKILAYKASRRSWLIQRSLRGGLYASCGKDSTDPTDIDACTVGVQRGLELRVHWLHLPETLLVSGTMAIELGLDGEFCLESSTAKANATPIFRRSSRPCAESVVIDGLLWLEYQEGFWNFLQSVAGNVIKLATCKSSFLRPDRLMSSCFGFEEDQLSLAFYDTPGAPLGIEVGGPETGPASHVRGEYRRSSNVAGRPSYVKPDASMRLFYSHDLGGWQLSTSSTGALAQQPHAPCLSSPERTTSSWQVLNDEGRWQEVPLAIMARPVPPQLSWPGPWPRPYEFLAGDYFLLSELDSFGRPSYALYLRSDVLNLPLCLQLWRLAACRSSWAVVSYRASRWQLSVNGQVLAAAAEGSASLSLPTGAAHWHVLIQQKCVPISGLMLEEAHVPFAILISGWDGVVNTAVNGEYQRRFQSGSTRPSYSKDDDSISLIYNEAEALWVLYREGGKAALATCGQAHVRNPAHLRPSCWRMGGIRAELRVQALEPTARLRLEMDTFCDGDFQFAGFWQQRPAYRQRDTGGPEECWLFYDSAVDLWTVGAAGKEAESTVQRISAVRPLFRAAAAGTATMPEVAAKSMTGSSETSEGWQWTSIEDVPSGRLSMRLRLGSELSAMRIFVKSRHEAAQMLDGLYLRVDDIDRRPAYNRSDGEPIVLKYSNTNGEWRFVTASIPPRLVAFSSEVQELRPETIHIWRIPKGGSLYSTQVILSMTAKVCRSFSCTPLLLLLLWTLAWCNS